MQPLRIFTPNPQPDSEPEAILLYCPEEGGWHTGVWWEGSWRLHHDINVELSPTHWLPAPPDVEITSDTGGHSPLVTLPGGVPPVVSPLIQKIIRPASPPMSQKGV